MVAPRGDESGGDGSRPRDSGEAHRDARIARRPALLDVLVPLGRDERIIHCRAQLEAFPGVRLNGPTALVALPGSTVFWASSKPT